MAAGRHQFDVRSRARVLSTLPVGADRAHCHHAVDLRRKLREARDRIAVEKLVSAGNGEKRTAPDGILHGLADRWRRRSLAADAQVDHFGAVVYGVTDAAGDNVVGPEERAFEILVPEAVDDL